MVKNASTPLQLRREYVAYIKNHKNLPEHAKDLLIPLIEAHFNLMSKETAALELVHRRTVRHEGE